MPSCYDVFQLQAYVDGELSPGQHAAVRAHLITCDRCRVAESNLRAVSMPLRQATVVEAPDNLRERILESVAGLHTLPGMSCAEVREALALAPDDSLDHRLMQRLEAHLQACGDCYRAAHEIDALVSTLREIEPEPVPAELLSRVMTAVSNEARQRRPQPVQWRRWAMSVAGLAAAAAIMLGVFTNLPVGIETPPTAVVAVAPPSTYPQIAAPQPEQPAVVVPQIRSTQVILTAPAKQDRKRMIAWSPRNQMKQPPLAITEPKAPGGASPSLPALPPPAPLAMVASLPPADLSGPVAVTVPRTTTAPLLTTPTRPAESHPIVTAMSPEPAPVHLALASQPPSRTAPSATPPPPVVADSPRKGWVSREPTLEHEVELADSRAERLALAKAEINHGVREVTRLQPKRWTID